MSVGPTGGFRRLFVQERDLQALVLSQHGKQQFEQAWPVPVGLHLHLPGLLDQSDPVAAGGKLQLRLCLFHVFPDVPVASCRQALHPEDLAVPEECPGKSLCLRIRLVLLVQMLEPAEGSPQQHPFFLRPLSLQVFPEEGRGLFVFARFFKQQAEEMGGAVELDVFPVDPGVLLVGKGRIQPCHLCQDILSPHIFQHADPLVSLLDIKTALILKGLDGIPDPFLQLGVVKLLPFHGKLRLLGKDRHEIPGKAFRPASGPGTHHQGQGDLHDPHPAAACGLLIFQQLIQGPDVRILLFRHGVPQGLPADPLRLRIFHKLPPSCRVFHGIQVCRPAAYLLSV